VVVCRDESQLENTSISPLYSTHEVRELIEILLDVFINLFLSNKDRSRLMNTNQNPGSATGNTLAEKYGKQADELSVRISHLETVSQDTAYREGFNLEALRRAEGAAKEDKVFLGGYAKGVLILGISALGLEKAEKFVAACGGWKSHTNWALVMLDGEKGEIRKNKAGTCWVIDLASPRREVMFAWTSGPRETRLAGPRLNTTNGGAHWCGLTSTSVITGHEEKNPSSTEFLRKALTCWKEHGMTTRQWAEVESARQNAERERHAEVVRAAASAGERDGVIVSIGFGYNPTRGGEYIAVAEEIAGSTGPVPADLTNQICARFAAKRQIEEEALLMAELETEQARIAEEKAKAEAEAKRQNEIRVACQSTGVSPEQWQTMTPKQQRLALHRARLAGKI
jgi:hypothetical protein